MNSIHRMAGLLVMLVLLLSNLSQVVYVSEAQTTTVTTTSTITSTVTSYTTVTSSTVTRTVTGTRTTYTTSTTTVDVTSTYTSTQTVATTVTRTTTTTITEQQTQDTTPPTVRVIAPNGGERLSPGSVFRIRWEASDNVGVTSVYIRLYQEGVMRVIIADNLQNTGYYDWTVPNRPGSNYKIVVIARDAAGNFGEDESNGTFEIVGATATAILQVGIRHTYIGDLRIWVGVEGGREVLIWNRAGGNTKDLFGEWDLLSPQLGFTTNDLPPSESRRWYLRIRDEAGGDEGRLEYFRIVYQGQTYESQDHPEIKDFQEARAWIPSRGVPSLPDLTVRDVSFSPQTVSQGGSITVSWTETNIDTGNAGPYRVGIYLGVSEYGRDYLLGSFNRDGLAAGDSKSYTQTFTIPSSVPPGGYYVTVFTDDLGAVSERNEENNIGSSTPNRLTVGPPLFTVEKIFVVDQQLGYELKLTVNGPKVGTVKRPATYVITFELLKNGEPSELWWIKSGLIHIAYDRRNGPDISQPISIDRRQHRSGWHTLTGALDLAEHLEIIKEITLGHILSNIPYFNLVYGWLNFILQLFGIRDRPPSPPEEIFNNRMRFITEEVPIIGTDGGLVLADRCNAYRVTFTATFYSSGEEANKFYMWAWVRISNPDGSYQTRIITPVIDFSTNVASPQ
jgi:hypothetical protein